MPGASSCIVKNCPRGKRIHPFPPDRPTKRKWLNLLTKASAPPTAGVCELHFSGNCQSIKYKLDNIQSITIKWKSIKYKTQNRV